MNTTKTLLAAAVLAAAGAANAAIIDTYTVSVAGTTGGLATGSLSGTGTATFDDTGVLTIDYTALNNQPAAGGSFYTTVHAVYNGTIAGTTFTNTSGTNTITSCYQGAGTIPCPSATPVGVVDVLEPTPPVGTNGGGLFATTFDINGGGSNLTTIRSYNNPSPGPGPGLNNKVTYTFSAATPAPAVPVPAAAWLFGSGLLGLAGTARRRRSA